MLYMNQLLEIARMIDHSVLHPTQTDDDLRKHCEIAKTHHVASVCVKPYAVLQAVEYLSDANVKVCCVVGFPHGNSATEVKVFEAETSCKHGATEIDMVINIAKAIAGDWAYVEAEIKAVTNLCHKRNAIVKVIFETDYITRTDDKIKLCQICSSLGVDFVKTSTGFGYVKQDNGDFNCVGATVADVALMRKHSAASVQVKASGGIRALTDLLAMKAAGATRIGTSATEAILNEVQS